MYKQDVGETDGGSYADSYITAFSNTPADPENATITYVSGNNVITETPLYLYVKDGDQEPAYYIFNISSWNGTETIYLSGFWPNQGAISHIAIYGGEGGDNPNAVPKPSTLLLLGSALVGLGCMVRKNRRE